MGTVLHEMLHAIGAQHEQSRSDRANNIRIRWDNTQPSESFNFDMKYTMNDRPYDLWSLMQYGLKVGLLITDNDTNVTGMLVLITPNTWSSKNNYQDFFVLIA